MVVIEGLSEGTRGDGEEKRMIVNKALSICL
jgi:hypothetical protein